MRRRPLRAMRRNATVRRIPRIRAVYGDDAMMEVISLFTSGFFSAGMIVLAVALAAGPLIMLWLATTPK